MDARSSKQSTAAHDKDQWTAVQLATDPRFIVGLRLAQSTQPMDQGSVAVAKGRCEQHLVLQLQVVPEPQNVAKD